MYMMKNDFDDGNFNLKCKIEQNIKLELKQP